MTAISFWNEGRQLKKVVEKMVSDVDPAGFTARYYDHCRLILVRRAPITIDKEKHLDRVEKFYFKADKLVHITFGGIEKIFPPDEWAYYERSLRGQPPVCTHP